MSIAPISLAELLAPPQELHILPHAQAIQAVATPVPGPTAVLQLSFAAVWQLFRAPLPLSPQLAHRAPCCTDLAALLLVRQLLLSQPETPLELPYAAVQATFEALRQLRLAGLTAPQLHQALHHAPGKSAADAPLQALCTLLGRFEAALQAAGQHDSSALQREVILAVAQGYLPARLRALRRVYVRAGTEVLGAQLDLLSVLAARGVAVHVETRYAPAALTRCTYPEALLHLLEARGHHALQVHFVPTPQLASHVQVHYEEVAAGTAQQAYVLRTLSGWLAAGVPTQAIALVTPSAAASLTWAACCREVGIPAQAAAAASLASHACVHAIAQLWRWASGGQSAAAPQRALERSALADVWATLGVPLQGLTPAVVACRLAQLPERYLTWTPLSTALRQQLATVGLPPAVVQHLQQFVQRFTQLPVQAPLALFLTPLQELLTARLAAAADVQDATLDALQSCCEQLAAWQAYAAAAPAAAPLWRAATLASFFVGSCQAVTLPQPAAPGSGIQVLQPRHVVGSRFAKLLWLGVPGSDFPRAQLAPPPLSEALRARLNKLLGVRLLQAAPLTGRAALPPTARDRWLWSEVLASCQESLVIAALPSAAALGEAPCELFAAWQATAAPTASALPPTLASPQPASLQRRVAQALQQRQVGCQLPPSWQPVLLRYLQNQLHSTTQLDHLGACAYRYFASAILQLVAPRPSAWSMTPPQLGSAAHAALYEVYSALRAQGGLQKARQQAAATQQQAAALLQTAGPTWMAALQGYGQLHTALQPLLLQHAAHAVHTQLSVDLQPDNRLEVAALEHRFSDTAAADVLTLHGNLQLHNAAATLRLRIRGSIDRVDCWRQGEHTTLQISDYKSTVKKRGMGRHFQLAIYSLVALRDVAPHSTHVQAAWRSLHDGKTTYVAELSGSPHEVCDHVTQALWARLQKIVDGDIGPDPDAATADLCLQCDFAPLCRFKTSCS